MEDGNNARDLPIFLPCRQWHVICSTSKYVPEECLVLSIFEFLTN